MIFLGMHITFDVQKPIQSRRHSSAEWNENPFAAVLEFERSLYTNDELFFS